MLPGTIYPSNVAGHLRCLSLYIVAFIGLTQACSPPEYEYEVDILNIVEGAEIILYGKVLNRDYTRSDSPEQYDARMEVYCTLKGRALPQFVKIPNAGYVPGLCSEKKLDVGKEYIIFMFERDGKLETPDEAPREITSEDAQRILSACNLVRTPIIGSTSIHARCPLVASETGCVRPPPMPTRTTRDVCAQPRDIGPCRGISSKWYYDRESGSCRQFNYGGCGGNDNRFDTEEECNARCNPTFVTEPDLGDCLAAEGDHWIQKEVVYCMERCTCTNGVKECHRVCPPAGLMPPPSLDCPFPRYAHTTTSRTCCPRLVCYDIPDGTDLILEDDEATPKTKKVKGKAKTGKLLSGRDSSAVVASSSILLILSLQLFVATLSI